MFIATLQSPAQRCDRVVGPVEFLTVRGNALQSPDGTELALHQGGWWMSQGICYIALLIESSVLIEFSHSEFPLREVFGSFACLRIVDGSAWAGLPAQLIARFDDTVSAWHIYTRPAAAMNILTIRSAE